MANLPTFNGNGNVTNWIAAMNAHFAEEDVSPEHALKIAMVHLSRAVRVSAECVRTLFELVAATKWEWTWVRLRLVLQEMQKQIIIYEEEADRVRTRQIIKGVALVGTGIAVGVAFVPVVLGVLGVAGFGAAGVVGGSTAAIIQGEIGSVAAGSLFAFCQSAAAGGAALVSVGVTGAIAGGSIAIGGTEASAVEWERIKSQMPSYSWMDGAEFKPSPDLLIALAKNALD